jgi:flavin reductase (DIM6/NTAB) family NADH-FMN oxidoreductase RutF
MDHLNAPPAPLTIAPTQDFVNAMAASAMGVSIVSTAGAAGRFGLTVSAWSSVSAEPPILLVCINRKNRIVEAITQNRVFAVNALGVAQSDVAKVFAGRPTRGEAYVFDEALWTTDENAQPLLNHAAAQFVCGLDSWHDVGTHRIFMGRVENAISGHDAPLLYHNRQFGKFTAISG